MILPNLLPVALAAFLLALLWIGLYTRRFCQTCDYCGRFYWWIGWAAFEWTAQDYASWAMRCKHCQWLTQQVHVRSDDPP